MRILLSCGANSATVLDAIQRKFESSGDEIFTVNYIEDIAGIFPLGNYFDKAIITDKSITRDFEEQDEDIVRHKLNDFANTSAARNRQEEYIFLNGGNELANIIYEETFSIQQSSAIVIKEPPYGVKFIASLMIYDKSQIPDEIKFHPSNITYTDEQSLADDTDLQEESLETTDPAFTPRTVASFDNMGDIDDSVNDNQRLSDDLGLDDGTAPEDTYNNGFDSVDGLGDDFGGDNFGEEFGGDDFGGDFGGDDLGDEFGGDFGGDTENFGDDVDSWGADAESGDDTVINSDVQQNNFEPSGDLPDYTEPNTFEEQGNFGDTDNFGGDNSFNDDNSFGGYDFNDNNFGDNNFGDNNTPGAFGDTSSIDNQNTFEDTNNNGYYNDQDQFNTDNNSCNEQQFVDNNENNNGMYIDGSDYYDPSQQYQDNEQQYQGDNQYTDNSDYVENNQYTPDNQQYQGDNTEPAIGYIDDDYNNNCQNNQNNPGSIINDDDYYREDEQNSQNGNQQQMFNQQYNEQNNANVNQQVIMNDRQIIEDLRTPAARGHSICVTGCGGCGTSTIAYNMANALANLGYTVLLVDFDTVNRTQSYISIDNYNSMNPDGANLMAAVNSSQGINTQVTVAKRGLHLLTMGMGGDVASPEETFNKDKITRFINLVKPTHNFVIYDVPFDDATGFLADVVYLADELVLVTEMSTHGIIKTMLKVCNVASQEMQDTLFSKSQIIFNKYRGLNKLLGKKIKVANDITKIMDDKVKELCGQDSGLYFSDMRIAGIINDDPDFEYGWFESVQYSDTAKGKQIFNSIVDNVVTHKN